MDIANKHVRVVLLGLVLGLTAQASMAELVVVVSASNPLAELSRDQVADIFLGRSAYFPGGGAAVPLDLAEDVASRAEFYRTITGKSAAQLKAYWSKLIFTGQGQPPRELPDAAAVKKAIVAKPDSIGYIDRSELDASVKAVLTPH